MNMLCFAPMHNHKRKDATRVFQPEAKRFLEYQKMPMEKLILVDNKKNSRTMRKMILDTVEKSERLTSVFFFCHGFKSGIQLGFNNATVKQLAKSLNCNSWHTIPFRSCFYACDTARDLDRDRRDDLEALGGDGGFADRFRDALCYEGMFHCRVDAHTTAGHASRNPNVRRFCGEGTTAGGKGGYYIVPFRSTHWTAWRMALKTDYRFAFPFLSSEKIISYLAGIA